MSQRGGAVLANLRLADAPIASDLIPLGARRHDPEHGAAREPALPAVPRRPTAPSSPRPTRSSTSPTTRELEGLLATIRGAARAPCWSTASGSRAQAGSARATNMVMVGAASHLLPVQVETLEHFIRDACSRRKGDEGGRDEPEGVPRGPGGGGMTLDAGAHPAASSTRRAPARRGGAARDRGARRCSRRSASPRPRTCSCATPARRRRADTRRARRRPRRRQGRLAARSSTRATSAACDRAERRAARSIAAGRATWRRGSAARRSPASRSTSSSRYDRSLGSELLLGLRWTDDFGAGRHARRRRHLHRVPRRATSSPGATIAIFSPAVSDRRRHRGRALAELAVVRLATGRAARPGRRGSDVERLVDAVERFMALAARVRARRHRRVRDQPARHRRRAARRARHPGHARLGPARRRGRPRPLAKLQHLLEPRVGRHHRRLREAEPRATSSSTT